MKSIALIPAFNEEETVGKVIRRLKNIGLSSLVVDDGSSDKTTIVAEKAGATIIIHETNKGKGEALKSGFEHILRNYPSVQHVVLIDADMQYSPKEAFRLLRPLEEGEADFVMGRRNWNKIPFANALGNFIWRVLFNTFFGTSFKDTNCGYMALTRNSIKKIKDKIHGGYITENSMLKDALGYGLKIKQVAVTVSYGKRRVPKSARMFFGVLVFIIKEGIKHRFKKV